MSSSESLAGLLAHARTLPNLPRAVERELWHEMHEGDERQARAARDKLVMHNARLAFKLARDWSGCGLPQEDLVQEALVGLNVAVDKFDPGKGRLTTYATRWIKKCLWDAAYGTSDTIKKPSRLSRTESSVREHVSGNPHDSVEEIAEQVGRPFLEVQESLEHARVVVSTSDSGFRDVGEEALEEVASVLKVLEPEEREAISWKHGLYGFPCSLDEVARKLTVDADFDGYFSPKDAARLCRSATRKLRAARTDTNDDVICSEE